MIAKWYCVIYSSAKDDEAEEAPSGEETEPEEEPEGEDLNEYDSEEIEDEENDGRPRKKKRKKGQALDFILQEAEVDDDPEDDEEWEDGAQELGLADNEVEEMGLTAREIEGRRRGTNLLE